MRSRLPESVRVVRAARQCSAIAAVVRVEGAWSVFRAFFASLAVQPTEINAVPAVFHPVAIAPGDGGEAKPIEAIQPVGTQFAGIAAAFAS
jgi:hypothetical protein